jgi:nucleoside-diphosphate-sugar epimerase
MILITGGTGAIGNGIVSRLSAEGKKIRLLALPNDNKADLLSQKNVEVWKGDISDKNSIQNICKDVTTVLHLAAIIITDNKELYNTINIEGTRNIIDEAKKSKINHFIHFSSASVLYSQVTPYSLSKKVSESLVRDSGLPHTIIRPTLVYGRTGGLEFDLFLDYLRKFPVVPFIGNGHSIKRPVYSEDIVDGIVKAVRLNSGKGEIYNFSGKDKISMIDFAGLCLKLMGNENKPVICLPVWFCKVLAFVSSHVSKKTLLSMSTITGVTQDADLDPSSAIRDFQYNPSSIYETLPYCFPRKQRS